MITNETVFIYLVASSTSKLLSKLSRCIREIEGGTESAKVVREAAEVLEFWTPIIPQLKAKWKVDWAVVLGGRNEVLAHGTKVTEFIQKIEQGLIKDLTHLKDSWREWLLSSCNQWNDYTPIETKVGPRKMEGYKRLLSEYKCWFAEIALAYPDIARSVTHSITPEEAKNVET